ncbi:hypothetical protein SLEP1_g55190 [Rubroshorea leprosula]|uniref:Uncharacterized protein n=1 Tax=Rubroshorea leprosula TaxID=152421 RepID=A0AAV5MEM6_9ROSI|nr:hypothetical protein SLEP1_g55190 [Rubroshorea leprosula]
MWLNRWGGVDWRVRGAIVPSTALFSGYYHVLHHKISIIM